MKMCWSSSDSRMGRNQSLGRAPDGNRHSAPRELPEAPGTPPEGPREVPVPPEPPGRSPGPTRTRAPYFRRGRSSIRYLGIAIPVGEVGWHTSQPITPGREREFERSWRPIQLCPIAIRSRRAKYSTRSGVGLLAFPSFSFVLSSFSSVAVPVHAGTANFCAVRAEPLEEFFREGRRKGTELNSTVANGQGV